jgi:hypothetical protein
MGNLTPNMSIFIPASGEELYGQAFAAGLMKIDSHDHSGAPDNGVPIGTDGIQDGAITPAKLSQQILQQVTATTTNGTPTQAASIPIAESSSATISGRFISLRDTATESCGGDFLALFHRTTGGSVALIGLEINLWDDSSGSPTIDLVADTLNEAALINCIGETSKTFNWTIGFDVITVPAA